MSGAGRIAVIVAAAGEGRRAGEGPPKLYRRLGGKSALRRALESLRASLADAHYCVAIHERDREIFDAAARDFRPAPQIVIGGESRQKSIMRALEGLEAPDAADSPEWVYVHDGARPFLSGALMERLCQAGADLPDDSDGVIPALPVRDALKSVSPDGYSRSASRQGLFQAQTPQLFRFRALLDAHRRAAQQKIHCDDDAEILERNGGKILMVEGDARNIKLTWRSDFDALADLGAEFRAGVGLDSHRFREGDHLMLGGARIDHDRGLAGHSDADPVLHALTDAILGAIGEGDIGTHFPSNDSAWKNEPSQTFLAFALERLWARGGSLESADVTIIANSPKISDHRARIMERLAELLSLPLEKLSVKGTTTDGMGLTGRGEGIGAQAVISARFLRALL